MPRPPVGTEADLLRRVLGLVRERLPEDWALSSNLEVDPRAEADALITLTSPDGAVADLVVEVRQTVVPRDLGGIVTLLRRLSTVADDARAPEPLLVARYLSPQSQSRLADLGVSYADATGNMRIATRVPALFLRDAGESKDPWRPPGRPRGSLKGEPAARVVRALVDYAPPFTVPRLVELSGASTGATYRVVDFLQEQDLVERAPRGPIESVRWRELLRRWATDFGFMGGTTVRRFLQPRGLPAVAEGLRGLPSDVYAVTGSMAAQAWAPYAPPRAATIYARDPEDLRESLGLREVDSGANVLVASAPFGVVCARAQVSEGLTVVAPSQAVVDLMSGPGRAPSEAEELLDWMERNVESWRR